LRGDSPQLALGLSNAQWTSVALLLIIATARTLTTRRTARPALAIHPDER
jgi:hypothetical protein